MEFRVDPGTLTNGDSYKGYYWYESRRPARVRSSLDDYRLKDEDKNEFGDWLVHKRLDSQWYIYLFVNG